MSNVNFYNYQIRKLKKRLEDCEKEAELRKASLGVRRMRLKEEWIRLANDEAEMREKEKECFYKYWRSLWP